MRDRCVSRSMWEIMYQCSSKEQLFMVFWFFHNIQCFTAAAALRKGLVIVLPLMYPVMFVRSLLLVLFVTNFWTVVLSGICKNQEINLFFFFFYAGDKDTQVDSNVSDNLQELCVILWAEQAFFLICSFSLSCLRVQRHGCVLLPFTF